MKPPSDDKPGRRPMDKSIASLMGLGERSVQKSYYPQLQKKIKELEKSEARYRLLAEHISDVLWMLTPKGVILYVSPSICRHGGYSPSQLVGKPLADILIPEHGIKFNGLIEGGIPENTSLEFLQVNENGTTTWIEMKVSTVAQTGDTHPRILGVSRDITRRKAAEAENKIIQNQLLQAQKLEAIGTLAGGIAHDFNNILTSIMGFTQISIIDLPEGHKAKTNLEKVLQAGVRARDLVSHILTFSRRSEEKFQTLNIVPVIKEVTKLLRASIPANIDIRVEIQDKRCPVHIDPVQIHQTVMNLCTNASQAIGSRHGCIGVSLEKVDIGPDDFSGQSDISTGRYIKLGVIDTGHGMDEKILSRIFDPYFTTNEQGGGTGLGLAVVHGIIKKHNGHITVKSRPGQGTSFCVYLPLANMDMQMSHTPVKETVPTGSEHILVVDDEQDITEMLELMLGALGYQVTTFTNPQKAFDSLQSRPGTFDLVISDMSMPSMTGKQLSRRILKTATGIPVIILTGFSDNLNPEEMESNGVCAVLQKPVLKLELAQCIRKTINQKRESNQL